MRQRPGRAGQLGFADLRYKNVVRCESSFGHIIDSWSPNDWMTAAAGELGEAANMLKKIKRGDYALDDPYNEHGVTYRDAVGWELADVVIYLDLLAARLGIELGEAVRAKFNIVSDRRGSDLKL